MSPAVQDLIRSFEALAEPERDEALTVLLQWSGGADHPPLSDRDLTAAADVVFLELDRREESGA
jgi:hypothetical protein